MDDHGIINWRGFGLAWLLLSIALPGAGAAPAASLGPYALSDGLSLTIASLQYTCDRERCGDGPAIIPNAAQKLLVVHYILQNTSGDEIDVSGKTVAFTAVSAGGSAFADTDDAGSETSGALLDTSLKPGQRVAAFKAIRVGARSVVDAVTVTPGLTAKRPLRIAVAGAIEPLASLYSDPAGPAGVAAAPEVSCATGTPIQVGSFDMTVVGVAYQDEPITLGDAETLAPGPGNRFALVTLHVACRNPGGESLARGSVVAALRTTSGAEGRLMGEFQKVAAFSDAQEDYRFGDERGLRMIFSIPKSSLARSLALADTEANARRFVVSFAGSR